jgi:transposase
LTQHFLPCEREQSFLMPPSLRDWLPEDHLAWFVLDVVEQMDLSPFYARYRSDGWGAAAYEPKMMVALLLYAYCIGERSSRRIEGRCAEDVAFRVICANQVPDHATIARFRQCNEAALAHCFIEILKLCRAAGLGRVGLVALDGTKVEANASIGANHTVGTIERQVTKMLGEAQQTDAEEDRLHGTARGDELPPELRDRGGRLARFARAKARLREEAAERERAYQEHLARRAALEAERGRPLRGRKPVPKRPRSPATTRANTTDPDSRVVKRGPTLIQGYNAQAVVTEDQIIVAACVTQDANDRRQLRPMLASAEENLAATGTGRRIGTLLADAGYWSDREIASLLEDPTAPKLLVATEDHPAHRIRTSPSARLRARMRRRLTSSRGQALYAKRPRICEPIFGEIKWTRGARRFMRRGLGACDAEWKLLCATNNLRKLWRATATGPTRA